MLRAVVVFALVAVAVATSPYVNKNVNAPSFASATQVRFVPRSGSVLATQSNVNGVNFGPGYNLYRVLSLGSVADSPRAPIRKYYGNVGKERFQDVMGNGLAAAGSLVLSLDPTAASRVIRDPRFLAQMTQVSLGSQWLVVPTYTQRIQSMPIMANDVVLANNAITLNFPTGFSGANPNTQYAFSVINTNNVAAKYQSGLRLNGEQYAANLAGTTMNTII